MDLYHEELSSLIRESRWVHPRDSRYSVRSFVTQPALSATWPTIDPTRSLYLTLLSSSHRCSLFFLSLSRFPSIPLWFLNMSLFTVCTVRPFYIVSSLSTFLPLFFYHFQFEPLHSLLPSLSRSCRPLYFHQHRFHSCFIYSSLSLFPCTLLSPYISFFLLPTFPHIFYLSPFFLHCDFFYYIATFSSFALEICSISLMLISEHNKVGGHVLQYLSHAR